MPLFAFRDKGTLLTPANTYVMLTCIFLCQGLLCVRDLIYFDMPPSGKQDFFPLLFVASGSLKQFSIKGRERKVIIPAEPNKFVLQRQ